VSRELAEPLAKGPLMAAMAGLIAMPHGPQSMLLPVRGDLLHTARGDSPPVRLDLASRTLETNGVPDPLESNGPDDLGAVPNRISARAHRRF
jgi:hypothetical protein